MRFGAILLCAGLLSAQTQPAAQDKCRVEGRVLNSVTSQPVPRARVTLRPLRVAASQVPASPAAAAPASALTDAEGKFVFNGVAAGAYQLDAQRDNFQPDPSSRSELLTLAAGDEKTGVVVKINPLGTIAGHVRNEEGDALQNLQVSVMVYQYGPGGRQLAARNSASTNDLGEYRVFGLGAGKYYLKAEPRMAGDGDEAYMVMYYPGADDPSGAASLDLGAGQELRGIDFTLRRTRAVSVRGRIVKPAGAGPLAIVRATTANGGIPTNMAASDPNGKFELRGLAPGAYLLQAQVAAGDKTYSARRPIQVVAEDIEGIELQLAPPVDLSGLVRIEGSTSIKLSQVRITFQGGSSGMAASVRGVTVNDDGAFALRDLPPDAYRVNAAAPGDLFVKAVRCGSADITESGLDLTGGGGCDLTVTLSANGAQIEGKVEDDGARPAAAAMVTLVAEGARRNDLFKAAMTDVSGHFKMTGVAPGSYRLYAWEQVDQNAVRYDPDFVKPFESLGQSLQITEGARESVSLKRIARPAGQ